MLCAGLGPVTSAYELRYPTQVPPEQVGGGCLRLWGQIWCSERSWPRTTKWKAARSRSIVSVCGIDHISRWLSIETILSYSRLVHTMIMLGLSGYPLFWPGTLSFAQRPWRQDPCKTDHVRSESDCAHNMPWKCKPPLMQRRCDNSMISGLSFTSY